MDFSNVPIILLVIGLVLLQFFLMRRRKPEVTQQEIVQNLLSEVRLNQALAETFHLRQKPKRFEVTSWQRSKAKLDFLPQPLQVALSDAFGIIEDFNQQIETAKKQKSASYMAGVNIDRLKKPLAESRQGLEQRLTSITGTKKPPAKYPGMFDDWTGRR